MIKFENIEVIGLEPAVRGMRNPMNSWDRSDSGWKIATDNNDLVYEVGPNDHALMMSLAKGGPVHAKYRRMINVYVDITAPLYWWKEFDTYKVGTVANSCSTMHKIHAKKFTLDDFSNEHLMRMDALNDESDILDDETDISIIRCTPYDIFRLTIDMLNTCRDKYLLSKTKPIKDETKRSELMKRYWWQMIQLLPSSYNQKRTVMLNYEVLHNIYHSRKNHKLDEWHVLCDWIRDLPYSEVIIGDEVSEDGR